MTLYGDLWNRRSYNDSQFHFTSYPPKKPLYYGLSAFRCYERVPPGVPITVPLLQGSNLYCTTMDGIIQDYQTSLATHHFQEDTSIDPGTVILLTSLLPAFGKRQLRNNRSSHNLWGLPHISALRSARLLHCSLYPDLILYPIFLLPI